jgi:outer membrane lipoprotein carrier protein
VNTLHAQTEGDQYLKSLQNKFNTIKDFTANIEQTNSGKSSLSGKIYFMKENNFRIEFGNSLIVSDGKSSWNHNKKENKVIITDYEEDGSLFSINYLVYQFPAQCDLKGEQNGNLRKLTLTPKSRTSNLGEVTLWINNDDLIEKIQTNDAASGLMELSFSNLKINQTLPGSLFQFSPPQESKIIDLRY